MSNVATSTSTTISIESAIAAGSSDNDPETADVFPSNDSIGASDSNFTRFSACPATMRNSSAATGAPKERTAIDASRNERTLRVPGSIEVQTA